MRNNDIRDAEGADETNASSSSITSMTSMSSMYIDLVPFELRGRAEWWEIKRKEILINEQIGEGGNGIINKVKWRGLICVVKCLRHKNDDNEYNDLKNEISVISHLRHPNLVLFLGACTVIDPLLLIYEYMPNGSLETYYNNMSKRKNRLWKPNDKYIQMWITELTKAIYFLHHCHYPIMHRDIKPSNILLNEDLHVKLTDFGLSRTIKKKHDIYKMSGCTGTLRYMAPELLFNKGEDYDLKIDIYSLALNFWFISTGKKPFTEIDRNPDTILLIPEGFRPNIKEIKNDKMKGLISKMWDTSPSLRPDIRNVLEVVENIKVKAIVCNIS